MAVIWDILDLEMPEGHPSGDSQKPVDRWGWGIMGKSQGRSWSPQGTVSCETDKGLRVEPGDHNISGQVGTLSGFCNFVRQFREGHLIHYGASSCPAPSPHPTLPG